MGYSFADAFDKHFSPSTPPQGSAPVPRRIERSRGRGGFALPIALGVPRVCAGFGAGDGGASASRLGRPQCAARYQARAAAALAFDAALDKLSAVAGDDRVATISACAKLLGRDGMGGGVCGRGDGPDLACERR
jgi:hypothetical protein